MVFLYNTNVSLPLSASLPLTLKSASLSSAQDLKKKKKRTSLCPPTQQGNTANERTFKMEKALDPKLLTWNKLIWNTGQLETTEIPEVLWERQEGIQEL